MADAVGTAIRLALAFATVGVLFDMQSYEIAAHNLVHDPISLYDQRFRWPYPPAYLAWVEAAVRAAPRTGLPFHGLIQLPAIAADAVIARIVHAQLLRRGAAPARALAGAALVALGPVFIAVSGYHGQFDAVAALPALTALLLWDRERSTRRALQAGALVGAAAALKQPLGLTLLALLPTAPTWRQVAGLAAPSILIPLATVAPFLVLDGTDTLHALGYHGVSGLGGIGLLLQPSLAHFWLGGPFPQLSGTSSWLAAHGALLTAGALLAAAAGLIARRVPPLAAAGILWLVLYQAGINFAIQYLVWGLPVLVIAGRLRAVLAIELVAAFAAVLQYARAGDAAFVPYVVAMSLLLVLLALTLASMARPGAATGGSMAGLGRG